MARQPAAVQRSGLKPATVGLVSGRRGNCCRWRSAGSVRRRVSLDTGGSARPASRWRDRRCSTVRRNWRRRSGVWPGAEERSSEANSERSRRRITGLPAQSAQPEVSGSVAVTFERPESADQRGRSSADQPAPERNSHVRFELSLPSMSDPARKAPRSASMPDAPRVRRSPGRSAMTRKCPSGGWIPERSGSASRRS